jgi:hypothetical protein
MLTIAASKCPCRGGRCADWLISKGFNVYVLLDNIGRDEAIGDLVTFEEKYTPAE